MFGFYIEVHTYIYRSCTGLHSKRCHPTLVWIFTHYCIVPTRILAYWVCNGESGSLWAHVLLSRMAIYQVEYWCWFAPKLSNAVRIPFVDLR